MDSNEPSELIDTGGGDITGDSEIKFCLASSEGQMDEAKPELEVEEEE